MAGESTLNEINEAIVELRSEVEKKSVDQDKVLKINEFLDKQEDFNQKALQKQEQAKKDADEAKERIDTLETELARKLSVPGEGKNYKESEEYKALQKVMQNGRGEINQEEKALLRTDSDVAGGYLVVGEIDNMITKAITEISAIRSIARVRTVGRKSLEMPVRNTIPTAYFEGEAEAAQEGASTYKSETITAFRQTVIVPITMDMLMDSSFDMESEIFGDVDESFAQGEGNAHILGTGVKMPEGFTVNPTVLAAARTSSTSATIDADDVILMTGDLKVGYDPVYVMNRSTLANLRTKKATSGEFLWQPGMNGPVANTINGYPYLLANDMPDIASNSLSIAFGDFRRGYTIIDRTGVSVIRDEVTAAGQAIVKFTIHRWTNAMVTLPEAIKLLKTAA